MQEAYQNQRVLITGGMGFIGSTLANLLVKQGAQVTLLDNFLADHGANMFNIADIKDQIQLHISDLRSSAVLNQLVQNQDVIFNLGGQTSHSDSMQDPYLDLDINCRGNLNLLEACRHQNPDARIVFVGTRAFYGTPTTVPVREDADLMPQDVYAVNRLAAEQYHFVYHRHYGLPIVSARLGNLYGPRGQMMHPRYNVLNYFIRLAIENQTIQIYGEGEQRRDYLYIEDACQALLSLGASEKTWGKAYNIGSGQSHTFLELVQLLLAAAGQGDYRHLEWPEGSKAYDVGDFVMDISAIQTDTDWRPETSIQMGFQQSLAFYRQAAAHYWS